MSRIRVAVVATHPIQYHLPWYRELGSAPDIKLKVFYGVIPTPSLQGSGFDVPFAWDIPMFDGYQWWVSKNSNARRLKNGIFSLYARDLSSALIAWRPDVALVTGWNSVYLYQAIRICRKHRIPMVVRGEVNGLKKRHRWAKHYHELLFTNFHAFLAIGKQNRAYYEQHRVPQKVIFDAPYFVDNVRFSRAGAERHRSRAEFRAKFGVADSEYCVLFVGKIIKKKRLMDLLRAFQLARGELDLPVRILVVGSGALMGAARRYSEQEKLPVSFAGFLNQREIVHAYAVADLLVLPSDSSETWGLVANEAMAAGLPVLISDGVGCAVDLVIPGKTGFTYPMGDITELKNRLVQLAGAPGSSSAMGRNAQAHVLEYYSVDRATRGTREAVEYARQRRIQRAGQVAVGRARTDRG